MKSVERVRDPQHGWWVTENGVRKANFRTRSEARLYASDGSVSPTPRTSTTRTSLIDFAQTHGQAFTQGLLARLDPIDRRVADLHLKGASQREIGVQVGLTQPSVSYHLGLVNKRLHFLAEMPDLDWKEFRDRVSPHITDTLDVSILLLFLQTTSQSFVANMLGVTQGLVRHRILRSEGILRRTPGMGTYVKALELVRANPNVLRSGAP